MSIRERLERVFRQVFALGAEVEVGPLQYQGIQAWDSVGHMQLVGALEQEFDLMLDTEDIIGLSSFDKAEEIIVRVSATSA